MDYLDGKLSIDQVDEFLDFLKHNPELKEELKSIDQFNLPEDQVSYPFKNDLFKEEENEDRSFNYRAVAYIEGNLSAEDQKEFLDELNSDPQKEREFDLLVSTKLKSETIIFPEKEKLYRRSAKITALYWTSRIAAVLIVLLAIWAINQQDFSTVQNPIISESIVPTTDEEKGSVDKKQDPIKKDKPIEKIKKVDKTVKSKKTKSLREKTKGRLKEMVIATPEISREKELDFIQPKIAQAVFNQEESLFLTDGLEPMEIEYPTKYLSVDEYLAKRFLGSKNDRTNQLDKVATASLKTFSQISNDKFSYQTNAKGKVSEISLNTRLLAFSIPLSKKK